MLKIIEETYTWAYNPGDRSETTHLVLHHAAAPAASAADVHNWHIATGWAGIAYHYYVRKDGSITRGRPETWRGGYSYNWKYISIDICFEGSFDSEDMPYAQKEAGRLLVRDIRMRHPQIIPCLHNDLSRSGCPGVNFPADFLLGGDIGDIVEAPESEKDICGLEARKWAAAQGLIGDTDDAAWQSPITLGQTVTLLKKLFEDTYAPTVNEWLSSQSSFES